MSAYITLLGAPGSGKGTQAKKIASALNISVVGIGDLIREEIQKQTDLGRLVAPIVNCGNLVPDSIITEIFKANITEELFNKGVIADGYPRNLSQAIAFDELFRGKPLETVVLYITVPYERLKARLIARGRADDTEAVIQTRNNVYQDAIQPIVDYFGKRVISVNGDREEAVIFSDILDIVKTLTYQRGTKKV